MPVSVFARLLPHVEQDALWKQVNVGLSAFSQPNVLNQRVGTFICPSDPNDRPRAGSSPTYPTCYGAGWGDWFAEDPATGRFGNGAFPGVAYPSPGSLRLVDITDGTSTTVGFAEVKAFGPDLNRAVNFPNGLPMPAAPSDIPPLGGSFSADDGHSSWAEAAWPWTGLTFVFGPNTVVPFVNPANGVTYDVDWSSGGGTTNDFGAVTAELPPRRREHAVHGWLCALHHQLDPASDLACPRHP